MKRTKRIFVRASQMDNRVVNVRAGGNLVEAQRAKVLLSLTGQKSLRKIPVGTEQKKNQWGQLTISMRVTLQPSALSLRMLTLWKSKVSETITKTFQAGREANHDFGSTDETEKNHPLR